MSLTNLQNLDTLRALDANGASVSGALLKVYTAGTTTQVTTFADAAGNTANAWPLVADASGAFGAVYLPSGTYDVTVQTPAGADLPGYPVANISTTADVLAPIYDLATRLTRSGIGSTSIPATVQVIEIAGYTTAGDGGGGKYRRLAASTPWSITSADGAHWELVVEGGTILTAQFGAIGDGTTDDRAAIQNAIDFALYGGPSGNPVIAEVLITGTSGGRDFRITDTVHATYGLDSTGAADVSQTITIRGGARRSNETRGGGARLLATFSDRPMMSVQSGANVDIVNLGFNGGFYSAVAQEGSIGAFNNKVLAATNSAVEEAWWVSEYGATPRYAPHAAIAIDPYGGTRPATSYADVTFPSIYTTTPAQYTRTRGSTNVTIEGCSFQDIPYGIVCQPSDFDANGDFLKVRYSSFGQMRCCVSVGNSQARTLEMTNNIIGFVGWHVTVHEIGRRSGSLNLLASQEQLAGWVGNFIYYPNGTAFAGDLLYNQCNAESLARIGLLGAITSNERTVTFQSCSFSLVADQSETYMRPAMLIYGSGGNVVMRSCNIANGGVVQPIYPGGTVNIQDMRTEPLVFPNDTQLDRCAYGAWAGIAPQDPDAGNQPGWSFNASRIFGDDGNVTRGASEYVGPGMDISPTGTPANGTHICHHVTTLQTSGTSGVINGPQRLFHRFLISNFTSVTRSGRILTATLNFAITDDQAQGWGADPGDVWFHNATNIPLIVRNRAASVITLEMCCGYASNGAGGVTIDPGVTFDEDGSAYDAWPSGVKTLDTQYVIDFTSGSAVATNSRRVYDTFNALSGQLAVGEKLIYRTGAQRDGIGPFAIQTANSRISSIADGANTMTMAANATRSETEVPLLYAIRAPFAGETPAAFPSA